MKIYRVIFGLLVAIFLARCSHSKINSVALRDTLEYSYKTVVEKAPTFIGKTDSGVDLVKIKYPKFDVQALDDTVRKLIFKQLFDQFNYFEPTTSVEQDAKNYVSGRASFMSKGMTDTIKPYCVTLNVRVVSQGLSFIAVELYRDFDGDQFSQYVNWDTEKNKVVNLNDICIGDYRMKLNSIAETVLKKQEVSDYKGRIDLRKHYELHPGSFHSAVTLSVSKNFLITKSGLKFVYNSGDRDNILIPGRTELFIPYNQVATLLRPNTVIQQYLK